MSVSYRASAGKCSCMFRLPLICSYFLRPNSQNHRHPQSRLCSTALKDGIRELQCGRVLIESKMCCRGQQQMAGTRQHDTIEDLMLFEQLHPQVASCHHRDCSLGTPDPLFLLWKGHATTIDLGASFCQNLTLPEVHFNSTHIDQDQSPNFQTFKQE